MSVACDRYVYAIENEAGVPCYIGIGKGDRFKEHLYEARNPRIRVHGSNKKKREYFSKCLERGYIPPAYKVAEDLTLENAIAYEKILIAWYGRLDLGTGSLFNANDGGFGGFNPAPSTRALKAKQMRERMAVSPETKRKIAESNRRPRSIETRLKLSMASKQKPRAHFLKMHEASRNLPPDIRARIGAKIGVANSKRKVSLETRRKMSESTIKQHIRMRKQKEELKMASQPLTKKVEAGLPAHLANIPMTGSGVSTSQDDMLIPMLRILQNNSPECEKKGASYVAGAEPGKVLIKNTPNPILDGEKGFLFQPCYFDKYVVEWVPRNKGGGGGGGFVARHDTMPDDAVIQNDPNNPERKITVRKSTGNLLVETRVHGGFIISDAGVPMPAVIPFASTGHTVSRAWTFLMAQKLVNGQRADSWAAYYRLTTRLKTKGQQSWYLFDVHDGHSEGTYWVPSVQDYERGKALHDSLASGARAFETGIAEENPTDDDKKPM